MLNKILLNILTAWITHTMTCHLLSKQVLLPRIKQTDPTALRSTDHDTQHSMPTTPVQTHSACHESANRPARLHGLATVAIATNTHPCTWTANMYCWATMARCLSRQLFQSLHLSPDTSTAEACCPACWSKAGAHGTPRTTH